MLKGNRNLLIVGLIAMVNMLGYGIIIPILYAYSKKFGLTDFQNGLLFAMFSICQFVSTPIIGRLSDKYGRRPMLLISILGTAASFFLMAFAPSAIFLFIARALDGLTAGNIPVVFAVISDSTKVEERAKAFGMVGAAFNFGFVFGPATAALTLGLGTAAPFIIAGVITLIAAIITAIYLPETNKNLNSSDVKHGKLIDFPLLWKSLFDPNLGRTFVISLVFFLAFSCAIIYGFQPFTMNVLKITQSQNAILFTLFGIVGLISQTFVVSWFSKYCGTKKAFGYGMLFTVLSLVIMFFAHSLTTFVIASVILGVFNSIVQTLIPTILSAEVDAKSQGTMMGLNTSYQSIGMIIGPILGGVIATVSIPLTFIVGAAMILGCYFLSLGINNKPNLHKESAF
jgi:MFS family permease